LYSDSSVLHFQTLAKSITGIDISSKMLEKAEEKGIYTHLIHNNLIDYAKQHLKNEAKFDLIIAADVFVYIGELEDIFATVKKILKENGIFIFSTEYLHTCEENFIVNSGGKIAHSTHYIEKLINQFHFTQLLSKQTILRKDGNKDVEGRVTILQNLKDK